MRKKRLTLEKFDPKGVPLREIILAHKQFEGPEALAGNLGDGFLLSLNPIFGNIRREFLRRGFTFKEGDIDGYFSFPLMSLDHVIELGIIPYRANFPWLEIIEKAAPKKFSLTELKRSELQFNYLFHESAHFVAHDVFFGKKKFSALPKDSHTLLCLLLGEAFANTVEAMSGALAQGEIGSYFLDANCHFRSSEKEAAVILKAARDLGWEVAFRTLLGAFLYSNYLRERLGPSEKIRLEKFAGGKAMALARIGMELSEEFRGTTTHFHLVKLGFPIDIEKMLKADPLLLIEPQVTLQIDELTKIVCSGLEESVEFERPSLKARKKS